VIQSRTDCTYWHRFRECIYLHQFAFSFSLFLLTTCYSSAQSDTCRSTNEFNAPSLQGTDNSTLPHTSQMEICPEVRAGNSRRTGLQGKGPLRTEAEEEHTVCILSLLEFDRGYKVLAMKAIDMIHPLSIFSEGFRRSPFKTLS
jgi:hypothetical protein